MSINDIPRTPVMLGVPIAVAMLPRPKPAAPPEISVGELAMENTQDMERLVNHLQDLARSFNRKLSFAVDERTKKILVKVIDKNTDKVVRELPSEEIVNMVAKLKEFIGAVFDGLA